MKRQAFIIIFLAGIIIIQNILFVSGQIPSIQKVNGNCFEDITEDNFIRSLSIKNIGSEQGRFLLNSLSCDNSEVSITPLSSSVIINTNSIDSISFKAQANSGGKLISSNCKINIIDEVTRKTDSCSFKVSIKSPIIICSKNEIKCDSDKNKITQCNFQGTEFSNVIKTCNMGEECQAVGSTFDCVKKPFFEIENIPFFPLLSLILAVIIVILWYLLVKNRINKK